MCLYFKNLQINILVYKTNIYLFIDHTIYFNTFTLVIFLEEKVLCVYSNNTNNYY